MTLVTTPTTSLRTACAIALLALAAGCGGGNGSSGSGSGTLPPPATTPTFTGTLSVLAGSPADAGNVDGPSWAARFSSPKGTALDTAGNLYVADDYNCTIRKVTPSGETSTYSGTRNFCSSQDGPAGRINFITPKAIAAGADGSLYVVDGERIRRIDAAGTVTTIANIPTGLVTGGSDPIFIPAGIAVDAAGNVFVTNGVGTRKIAPSGATTIIEGVDVVNGLDGVRIMVPRGIAVDAAGTVYVGALEGGVKRIAGTTTSTVLGADAGPVKALALDPQGNLYISSADVVRRITPAGAVATVAGTPGSGVFVPGTLPGSLAGTPAGMSADGKGNVYFTTGNAVAKITLQ
jgi:sugar lactone lactonase YvrE